MSRKKMTRNYHVVSKDFNRILLAFVFTIIYACGSFLLTTTTYAAGVPGGNISDPVVRAVDIAKPAIVRILTTLNGRLTVHFTSTNSATFPLDGSSYKLQYLGSGAFISANGDILTADHVIRPPHDASVDQDLYQMAAQDVADYINNNLNPPVQWTSTDAFSALSYGQLLSRSQYDAPTSMVYLSTDFTGPMNVTTLDAMPQNTFFNTVSILKESNFQSMDTAIIHVNMNNTPSIELGDSTNVEQQDELTIIGFPGNGDISDTADPSTGFLTASVNRVYVSALKPYTSGAPLIQVGGNVEHGDSGGPALDSNGNIVGVVSFGGSDMPDGTSFLQASSSAKQLINELQLDTQPGAFQTAWDQAFAQYSSTSAGHWHNAQQQMQKLQANYPNFHAIQPYLDYASAQASKEKIPTTNTSSFSNTLFLIGIILIVLVVIFLLVLILFLVRRKKRPQAAPTAQPSLYQATYNGSGVSSATHSMVQIESAHDADPNVRMTPDGAPLQSPVPQTPAPIAASNFGQSSPMRVVPNQPPMSPWPQPQGGGYGSTPSYRQGAPYGQQPPRPMQDPPNAAYPYPEQAKYMPNGSYPQAYVEPWPPVAPVQPNAQQPRLNTPYIPQNPVQQGTPLPRGQESFANGAPYMYGQPPQSYGATPAPQQPRPAQAAQQPSGPVPVQQQQALTPPGSNEPTVRVKPQGMASGEMATPAEGKRNMASSIPDLSKDRDNTVTTPSEQGAPTSFSSYDGPEEH